MEWYLRLGWLDTSRYQEKGNATDFKGFWVALAQLYARKKPGLLLGTHQSNTFQICFLF